MADYIHVNTYKQTDYDDREILRYAGAKDGNAEITELLEACKRELGAQLTFKVCHTELPIKFTDTGIDLGITFTESANLRKNLTGCSSVVVFGATAGIAIDRFIARYNRISPSRALMFQAIGAERIEALCDIFNREITEVKAKENKFTRPRFSPGYGDLPLDIQRDIFRLLDCPRRIGLTLNESLLMSPSKSVTAMIGIGNK